MIRAYFESLSTFARDVAERAAATFVQTFLASVPLTAAVEAALGGDVATLQALGMAAGTAALAATLSVAKSMIAKRLGDPESASLDPAIPSVVTADGDPIVH